MGSDAADLGDRLAVQDVLVRYAACIDDRDFEAYRSCFAPDVELPGFGPEPIQGIDAWIEFVRAAIEPFEATQHMLGPPRIELRDGQAQLRTALQAQHFHREPRGRIFSLWGTYHSTLVKADGAWRLRRHSLEVRATRTHDRFRT